MGNVVPELMTIREYIPWKQELYRVNGIEVESGIAGLGKLESEHLSYVREAVRCRRDIHVENRHSYGRLVDGLCRYSSNGNLAVFDAMKKPARGLTAGDIDFSEYLSKKRR